MGISAALLAYKEAENLRVLLPQIHEELKNTGEDYEILVIDTQTPTDDTQDVCALMGAKYIPQEAPKFGGAFRTAIRYASKAKFLIMDADGSHKPEYIGPIYASFAGGADVVIGSRYTKGGRTKDSPLSIGMSKLLNFMYRWCIGIKAKDISTDFRMYHTEQLKRVTLTSDNYDVLQEVLLMLKLNKPDLIVREAPITFDKRLYGESKRRLLPFILSYIKTLFKLISIRFRNSKQYGVMEQIFLYGVFGLLAACVDYGVFSGVNYAFGSAYPEIANISGMLCGFFVSFCLNTRFTFKKTTRLFRRFISYFSVCLAGMAISSVLLNLLKHSIELSLLKLMLMALVAGIQFLLNKLITFRD